METHIFNASKEYALALDKSDELARFHDEFYIQDGTIYMDGNSLGLLSKRAERSLLDSLEDWKAYGIDGWTKGTRPWFFMAEKIGEMIAPLIGAELAEVVATNSTTVNLHQLVATFYKPEGKRTKIIADELDFSSDIYALKSQLALRGLEPDEHLVRVKSRNGNTIEEDDIIEAMTDDIALVVLPTVLYRSGQLLDIERLTKAAHERGIVIGFDACHSVGVVPHRFSDWGVDFGFWCNYKYLNGGPGSVGALYINKHHFGRMPGLAGWFSSRKDVQFNMAHTFIPSESAGACQIGSPHILSMAPLIGSLEIFAEAGIERVREKSLRLTRYLIELIESELPDEGFSFGNPIEDNRRGGHISLEHAEAVRIAKSLKEHGVICDHRPPHIIRLTPVALYTSFTEVRETVQILKEIMANKEYEKFENRRGDGM